MTTTTKLTEDQQVKLEKGLKEFAKAKKLISKFRKKSVTKPGKFATRGKWRSGDVM